MGRHHAVVVVAGGNQRGGIAFALADIVQRRIFVYVFELTLVVAVSVLHAPSPPYGEQMIAQHVHYAHRRQRHCEKVRPLGHAGAHQQAAVRAARNGELFSRRIPFPYQIFGRSDEVVEHVLLVFEHACTVPLLAVLSSSAKIDLDVHAALLHEKYVRRAELRSERNVESSIAVQQRRIVAVQPDVPAMRDEHGHPLAVLAFKEYLFGDEILRVVFEFRLPEQLRNACERIVAVNGRRREVRSQRIECFGMLVVGAEGRTRHRTFGLQFDGPHQFAGSGILIAFVHGIFQIRGDEVSAHARHAFEHVLSLWNDIGNALRVQQIYFDQPVVRCGVVGVDIRDVA